MRGLHSGDKGNPHYYYACSDRRRYGNSACAAPYVAVDALERELLDWLATCQPDSGMEPTVRTMVKRGQRTAPSELNDRRAIKRLEERRERAIKVWKDYGDRKSVV